MLLPGAATVTAMGRKVRQCYLEANRIDAGQQHVLPWVGRKAGKIEPSGFIPSIISGVNAETGKCRAQIGHHTQLLRAPAGQVEFV